LGSNLLEMKNGFTRVAWTQICWSWDALPSLSSRGMLGMSCPQWVCTQLGGRPVWTWVSCPSSCSLRSWTRATINTRICLLWILYCILGSSLVQGVFLRFILREFLRFVLKGFWGYILFQPIKYNASSSERKTNSLEQFFYFLIKTHFDVTIFPNEESKIRLPLFWRKVCVCVCVYIYI